MAFSATTDFPLPNTMRTRASADDQMEALGEGGGANLWSLIRSLRRSKEKDRREAAAWDQLQALKMKRKEMELMEDFAPDPLEEAMTGNQILGIQQGGQTSRMMQTKDLLDRMRSGRPSYGINQGFFNMPAAAAMTGMNLPKSGFEVYADIAKAGILPDRSYDYMSNEKARRDTNRPQWEG